jgi:hypothetical protein
MRFFFFGTLMDPEVRRVVIGRDLAPGQIEAAVLEQFRRVYVANRNYPMLLPHSSGWVDGLLAHNVDPEAARRLMAFEGREYHLVPVTVADLHGHLAKAAAFLPDRTVKANRRAWYLEIWQRRYKRLFLRRAAELMDRYGTQAMLRVMPNGLPAVSPKHPKLLTGKPPALSRVIVQG